MITAAQCEEAAELLAEREEIAEPLAAMLAAKRVRIEYAMVRDDEDWRAGRPMPMTKEFRALLTAGTEKQIADIDAKLRALGVQPPSAEVA